MFEREPHGDQWLSHLKSALVIIASDSPEEKRTDILVQQQFVGRRNRLARDLREKLWSVKSSNEVRNRFQELDTDISVLKERGVIPQSPERVLDVGSGSGAGSVALKRQFPQAEIVAIDNESTHQPGQFFHDPKYKVRKPPLWAACFHQSSIENFSRTNTKFDFIMAARLPIIWSTEQVWKERCLKGAHKLLILASMLTHDGALVFGYEIEDPLPIDGLRQNFKLEELCISVNHVDASRDSWLIMQGIKNPFFADALQDSERLLTETGRRRFSPYEVKSDRDGYNLLRWGIRF